MISALLLAAVLSQAPPAPDYAALYAQGVPFSEFLDGARARRDEWTARYRDATVSPDLSEKARALPSRRRLLVVTDDRCSDSRQTVPYLAKLVLAAPDRLEMRIVSSTIGQAVKDTHLTPDGRGATPTVVVLDQDGHLIGAWIERPAELQAWSIEQRKILPPAAYREGMAKWYAGDKGRSALAEIMTIVTR